METTWMFLPLKLHRKGTWKQRGFLDQQIYAKKSTWRHRHKKRKDSMEGSLDRVLLAIELEFPKILVPRLSQHTSDVNFECAGNSE